MMDDEFRCVKLQNYTELQILFEMRAHQTRNMHTGNISLSDCVCVCVGYGMFFGISLEP